MFGRGNSDALSAGLLRAILICTALTFTGCVPMPPPLPSAGQARAALAREAPGLEAGVLDLALTAYYRAHEIRLVARPRLTVIDYSLPSYEKRLWVFDMSNGELLFHEWVAHGMGRPEGTGGDMEQALQFSNVTDSWMSSLGLFLTQETYRGRNGRSLRIQGLEEGFNDAARDRLIVVHGAKYVSRAHAESKQMGRSRGCPAVRKRVAKKLIKAIRNGSVLWIYAEDETWLEKSRWITPVPAGMNDDAGTR